MNAVFRVSAYRKDGSIFQDRIESASQAEAVAWLLRQGLSPFEVAEADAHAVEVATRHHMMSSNDMLEFCRSLGALLNGGLPLDEALGMVANDIRNGPARKLAEEARTFVVAGDRLAEALKKVSHPPAPFVMGLVQAGEASGDLAPAFRRLTEYLGKDIKLRSEVRSALVYPVILSGTAITAILLILLVVTPTLKPVLLASGQDVPKSAAYLVAVSDFVINWGAGFAIVGLTGLLGAMVWLRSQAGMKRLGQFILQLPLIGQTIREIEASRFLSSLSALLDSGMPLVPAMNVASAGVGTANVSEKLNEATDLVRQGGRLSDALEATHAFPPLAAHMAAVSERSGNAPAQLAQAAEIFEASAQQRMERIVALVPPVMTLSLGGVIGFVVLTLLSAVMSINDLAI